MVENTEENKDIIIEDLSKVRFSGASWFKAGPQDIIIGGVGGIGSWLALFLSRIGHNLYLFDGDIIEDVNLAGQFYSHTQVGKTKVAAVAENIKLFSNTIAETHDWYTEDSYTAPIVFSCFDNMKARQLMFEKWAADENREVFIDGRLLMEVGMVFCVQKGQEDLYRAQLFEDSEVEEIPCNHKATSHAGALIGSIMTACLNNYLSNKLSGMEISTVQFRTDFMLPMMMLEEVACEIEEIVET